MPRRTTEPKEHVIPLRVNKEEWTMARLKAAVYFRGNMSEFLRKAMESYEGTLPEMKCFHCKTPLVYGFDGTCEWGDVTVTNVPAMTCPNCRDQSYDMAVMEALEVAVEGKTGPFDFRELMNHSDAAEATLVVSTETV